jgi:hypothetical protein
MPLPTIGAFVFPQSQAFLGVAFELLRRFDCQLLRCVCELVAFTRNGAINAGED